MDLGCDFVDFGRLGCQGPGPKSSNEESYPKNVTRAPGAPCGSLFGCILVVMEWIVGFQACDWLKMAIQMMDFLLKKVVLVYNGGLLVENGVTWEQLGVTWGSLEAYFGYIRGALGDLWVILEPFGGRWGSIGCHLGVV